MWLISIQNQSTRENNIYVVHDAQRVQLRLQLDFNRHRVVPLRPRVTPLGLRVRFPLAAPLLPWKS
jgi:hypothetical protein